MIEFSVLGRNLCASNVESHWERWLRTHWQYPEGPLEPSGFTVTLEQRDRSPALKGGDWQALELTGHAVAVRLEADRVTLGEESGGAQLNVGRVSGRNADVMIEFWGQSPAIAAMLHALLSEALRVSGLLSLHASAAVRRGAVTAFLGIGGAGKTTTLLRAWCAGWEPLCEDLLWLEPTSLTAHGWDRGLRLLPDTVQRFRLLLPGLAHGHHQLDKWFVPYADLGSEPRSATLWRVALLGRGDSSRTVWAAASRRETALALWQATGLPLTKVAQDKVSSAIAALTDRLERRRLMLGACDFSPLPDSETTP